MSKEGLAEAIKRFYGAAAEPALLLYGIESGQPAVAGSRTRFRIGPMDYRHELSMQRGYNGGPARGDRRACVFVSF